MKKSDLKYGNVVELRDGTRLIYSSVCSLQLLIPLDGNGSLDYEERYSNGLKHKNFCGLDIMEIYKDYTCEELLWERKEKPQLTEDEKVILRNVPQYYKWIARDANDCLYVYANKPEKRIAIWEGSGLPMIPFDHLFQFIKWEDDEPYSIEELLKGE